jgi:hypothetical protein
MVQKKSGPRVVLLAQEWFRLSGPAGLDQVERIQLGDADQLADRFAATLAQFGREERSA